MSLDSAVFNFIYGFSGRSPVLDFLGIFSADYLPYILILFLLVLLLFQKYRTMAVLALASGITARFAVKELILMFYQRPRPYIALPEISKLIWSPAFENLQSFPSGHALFFFAASTMVYLFNKKLGIAFFAISIIIGLARVFVGVHWPSDILAGALLGGLTSFIIYQFSITYKKQHDQQR